MFLIQFLGLVVNNLNYWGSKERADRRRRSWKSSDGNLFREKFPTTYAIDGSEVFIETPSDLAMQSSTWSSYKHHNTVKFLVACTPNRAICFVSPVYVGSILDVELTRVSGFLDAL